MDGFMSFFAMVVAVVALLIAMTAYDKAVERENKPPAPKPKHTAMNDADRRRMAVEMRQHENFMNYDGKPQNPIDEATILEE